MHARSFVAQLCTQQYVRHLSLNAALNRSLFIHVRIKFSRRISKAQQKPLLQLVCIEQEQEITYQITHTALLLLRRQIANKFGSLEIKALEKLTTFNLYLEK